MHIVIFGLTISSSWGNGHATLWRGLVKAMLRRQHTVTFYEKDVPYYAGARDVQELPQGARLRLYDDIESIRPEAMRELTGADLALCTSYCPDGVTACRLVLDSKATLRAFYDLDTPVTLDQLRSGVPVEYLPANGLCDFDLVLSYTGGRALEELQSRLGARAVEPLYGSVDPEAHFPVPSLPEFESTLSYLGTYAADRQAALDRLFLEPARRLPAKRFLIGGAQYPEHFPWTKNLFFTRHLSPPQHPAFYCSARATLNITRRAMAEYGSCPSPRLFEAAACGVPLLSDGWEGLDRFFAPGEEILRVDTTEDVLEALGLSDAELRRIGESARTRVLAQHTAEQRVVELEAICERTEGAPRETVLS
jgi:spore maturation protein CgeB